MMDIPIPEADPRANLIEFKPQKRTGTLEPKGKSYNSCRHTRAIVDEADRTVTCRDCPAVLDAFTVLLELAEKQRDLLDDLDAWDARRESELGERYDREWMREAARGTINTPPEDPETRKIWDTFHALLGDKFCKMFKRKGRLRTGPEWYGCTTNGGRYSYEYVRQKLVPRAAKA